MQQAVPKTIDEYLAPLAADHRTALEKLRRDIHAAAPGVVECISYRIPGFRLDGRLLVSLGDAAKHCAFYPGSHPIEALAEELADYDTSKGTIRFPPEKPLPAALVRKIVAARIAELGASRPATARRRR
jgi:uncharacterized protein YdhG (YjbR/CyaY superfamily)